MKILYQNLKKKIISRKAKKVISNNKNPKILVLILNKTH